MSTRKWFVGAALVAVVGALVVLAPAALADDPEIGVVEESRLLSGLWMDGGACMGGMGGLRGRMGFGMHGEASLVVVTAEVLEMERAEVIAALRDGKTIAELAEEKGVDPERIVDAFIEQRAERLAELVDSGRLTQEQADAMLEMMTEHVIQRINEPFSPRQPGGGMGRGGRGGGR